MVKNLPANAGDASSIPGLERSPARGNGNPLQYSCLENSMDRGAWRAAVHGASKELDKTEHMYILSPHLSPSLNCVAEPRKCQKMEGKVFIRNYWSGDFPGDLPVKSLCFHCREGTRILHAVWQKANKQIKIPSSPVLPSGLVLSAHLLVILSTEFRVRWVRDDYIETRGKHLLLGSQHIYIFFGLKD